MSPTIEEYDHDEDGCITNLKKPAASESALNDLLCDGVKIPTRKELIYHIEGILSAPVIAPMVTTTAEHIVKLCETHFIEEC